MPFKQADLGAQAPKGAHLAVVTDESGELLAMPPGSIIYIVEDATNPEKIFPMALRSASRRKIAFECVCHDPNCSRTLTYTLTSAAGHHMTEQDRIQQRARKELMRKP